MEKKLKKSFILSSYFISAPNFPEQMSPELSLLCCILNNYWIDFA
jgi:hypothetical protein